MNHKDKLNIYCTEDHVCDSSWIHRAGGETISTPHGDVVVFTKDFDASLFPAAARTSLRAYCAMHRIEPLHLHQCIFFDVETTSLSSGTGNYAFIIGLGYVNGNTFTVKQLFMRSYSDEAALLHYFLPILNAYKAIVTFNGKSFDIPIIKTRYRLNRVPGFPVNMPVIDVLKPARSIFKSIYSSCSLKSLEELLLGISRTDDIPGYLIPDVYFTYQQKGFDPRLPAVIEHNRMDITSMVSLLIFFNTLYDMIHEKQFDRLPAHLYKNIAKHLYTRSITLFIQLIEYAGYALLADEHTLFKKYSTALKRSGHHEKALSFWADNVHLFSLEELAKHHEHKVKDYHKALEYCSMASALISSGEASSADIQRYAMRFAWRINRLNKKILR